MDANERQKHYFMEKIFRKYNHNVSGLTFAVLGQPLKIEQMIQENQLHLIL